MSGGQQGGYLQASPTFVSHVHPYARAHATRTLMHTHRFIHINCLSFSMDEMYLVTSSSTETVHIFRLVEPPSEKYLRPDSTLCQLRVCYLLLCFPSCPQASRGTTGVDELPGEGTHYPCQLPPITGEGVCVCVCVCTHMYI